MALETTLLVLFVIAAAVAIVSHRLKLPYTIALVVTGLSLGALGVVQAPHLTKDLLFLIILPGLLFEASLHMQFREFWEAKLSIFSLAIPGLLVATAATGLATYWLVNALGFGTLTLLEAMVFGALISATDPISVLAIFKALGVDRKLYVLVEGESLFNDGTAVVVFNILLVMALGGEASVGEAAFEFVKVAGMATLIGGAVGYAGSLITRTIDAPVIEITLTALIAYGAFIVAEHFHFSGVIACVVAGMLTGNWATVVGMGATTRLAVVSFWEYAAFVLNSLVFLLVGFEIQLETLVEYALPSLVVWGVVLLGRAGAIALKNLVVGLVFGRRARLPARWATVLTWGGLRGSLSMVLALALPPEFEHRELVLNLTFGVVVLSILVQGLTMKPLLVRLGLVQTEADAKRQAYEELLARLRALRAAEAELEALRSEGATAPKVLEELGQEHAQEREALVEALTRLNREVESIREEEERAVRRSLLTARREALVEAKAQGIVSEPVFERLATEIDEALLSLGGTGGH